MSQTVIKIENLYKEYKLGVISHGTLYRDLQSWWARIRGKEDPNSLISAQHTEKAEKESFLALIDISMEIKAGERVGIIGKNGAGKSTLLKILSRITSPTKGIAKIKGRVGSLLEVGTGFHPELTGRENIYLNGAILGMNRHEVSRKLDEIVDFAGIEKHLDTPVKRYSSGMTVRLGFAVAAHLETDILIADEVLAVGDAEFQNKALGKMKGLSTGEGRTIIFVSHNMVSVKSLCNCGIVLERGKIKEMSNNVDKLVTDYLVDFSAKIKTLRWVNTGEYNDPSFTPISLELQEEDGAEITTPICADKNYKLKLAFEIKEKSPNFELYYVFSTIDGAYLFISSPREYNNNYRPAIGLNTLYCIIPKNLLNKQEYNISLAVGINNERNIIDSTTYTIALRVSVVSNTTMNLSAHYKTPIAPKLDWYTN
ncbi:MAG: ABC transporter ATP-binding protein [Spirochaetes bacterium]|nr:ABC transporter ATP-binding protein [Spirochaetota bacterium]